MESKVPVLTLEEIRALTNRAVSIAADSFSKARTPSNENFLVGSEYAVDAVARIAVVILRYYLDNDEVELPADLKNVNLGDDEIPF